MSIDYRVEIMVVETDNTTAQSCRLLLDDMVVNRTDDRQEAIDFAEWLRGYCDDAHEIYEGGQ